MQEMNDEFERALAAFFTAAGADVPAADETGARLFRLGGVELKLVRPPDDPHSVDCEAYVGSIAEVADKATLALDALEANFFWEGTRGGTLGLGSDDDDLVLSDRRDTDDLLGEGALGAWLAGVVQTVTDWRLNLTQQKRMADEAEAGEEVAS